MNKDYFVLPVKGTLSVVIAIAVTFLIIWMFVQTQSLHALWGMLGYILATIPVMESEEKHDAKKTAHVRR